MEHSSGRLQRPFHLVQATLEVPATERQQLMLDTHRSTHVAMGRVRQSMRDEHALLIKVRTPSVPCDSGAGGYRW